MLIHTESLVINGVKIGDRFKNAKRGEAVVVDFQVVTSLVTLKQVRVKCIAQTITELSEPITFETPFATVKLNKL